MKPGTPVPQKPSKRKEKAVLPLPIPVPSPAEDAAPAHHIIIVLPHEPTRGFRSTKAKREAK